MKKDLDVEINLLPFIGLLSVCICFLLLAAIWVHVGSINVKQAIGSGASTAQKEATLWTYLSSSGDITLKLENVSKKVRRKLKLKRIKVTEGKPNFSNFQESIIRIRESLNGAKVSMAMIVPHPKTRYQDMIKVMDILSTEKFKQIGVVPI